MTDWISGRPNVDLECRTLRHSWELGSFRRTDHVQGLLRYHQVIEREVNCTRCGARRIDYFGRHNPTSQFVKIKGKYIYEKNYLYRGEAGTAPKMMDYFAEWVNRSIPDLDDV